MKTTARVSSRSRIPTTAPTLWQVRPTLWRVIRTDGSLAGYIESASGDRAGVATEPRFEARRLIVSTRQVMGIGDFSTIDDALQCFQ
ncbi:hypothetical protein BH09ACT6_BH09ACT6_09600 [soil metagenome]